MSDLMLLPPVQELTPAPPDDGLLHVRYRNALQQLIDLALATCVAEETRRIYAGHLKRFTLSALPLTREGVASYLKELRDDGKGSATVLGALAALRKLADEAKVRGLMSYEAVAAIHAIKGGKHQKHRAGMWLTVTQVKTLLELPDRRTYYGQRDAAILTLLLGCGLRREEMADLTWAHYQSRENRMCLVDLTGKGSKKRTVPVPTWGQPDVDAWKATSQQPPPPGVTNAEKAVQARLKHQPDMITGGLGYEGIYDLVEAYGNRLGVDISPHDLRRTLAQMLRKAGAALEQIQHMLGHSSIETTTIYLGSTLELERGRAAVDQLDLGRPQ